jgi:hypothetical protein
MRTPQQTGQKDLSGGSSVGFGNLCSISSLDDAWDYEVWDGNPW